MEIAPQLTEPAVAGIPEEGGSQSQPGLFLSADFLQSFQEPRYDFRIIRRLLDGSPEPFQSLCDFPQAQRQHAGLAQALRLLAVKLQRQAIVLQGPAVIALII